MKKIIQYIKSNYMIIIGFIVGIFLSGIIVYASIIGIDSDQVIYNKSSSLLNSTNVKGALDELYEKSNSSDFFVKKYLDELGKPVSYYYYYDTLHPSEQEPVSKPLSKWNVYTATYADGQQAICIKYNGKEHCFLRNNHIAELKHLQSIFSENMCKFSTTSNSAGIQCGVSDIHCTILFDGRTACTYEQTITACGFNIDTGEPLCFSLFEI